MYRYIITNYEKSNFSVFQSKYEEELERHLVAIPSASGLSNPNDSNLHIKVGSSVGSIVLVGFIVLVVSWAVRRRRKSRKHGTVINNELPEQNRALETPADDLEPKEIDMNSLIGHYRQMADNGRAELLEIAAPSGSGHDLSDLTHASEISAAASQRVHELMTYHSSNKLDTPNGIQNDPNDYCAIVVATDISQDSWFNRGPLTVTPSVETTIRSMPRAIANLDRSLPPTPISESAQNSPVVTDFQKRHAVIQDLRPSLRDLTALRAIPGNIANRASRATSASMELEIVIPPGFSLSEAEVVRPLTIRKSAFSGRERSVI